MEIFKLFGSILVEDKAAMNSLSKVDKEGSKLADGFSKVGKIITAAFSVAAIVGFGKKIIEASANLQAMEAQFDQIFKGAENEQAVSRITKQVDDLGIHADRLTGTWNKFGGQVKGAGMEGEKALTAVDKATRLAADGAAFYDKSLESSSDSLASFMKGNFAAGDAIGVFTNAKQMDIKSNEMYGKSWKDLSEAERQWLLLDTVEKTYEMNGAMGQASREAGAYENVMGNLKATFQRLYATIGEPVLQGFLVVVQTVTKWIESNIPTIEKVVSTVFGVVKDVVKVAYDWFNDNLLPILVKLFEWIKSYMPEVQKISEGAFKKIIDIVKVVYDWFKTYILPIFTSMYNWVSDNFPRIQLIISGAFEIIISVGKTVWELFSITLLPILEVLLSWVSDHFGDIGDIIAGVFEGIISIGETVVRVFDDIVGGIRDAIDWVKSWNKTEAKDKSFSGGGRSFSINGSHADGLEYVPFDGYIAQLHKGERVLTAEENRAIQQPLMQPTKTEVHLHVGTMIADNFGLRQLERKLRDIRIEEDGRLGVDLA